MIRVAEIAGDWFGLCRKPPASRAVRVGEDNPPACGCKGVTAGRLTGSIPRGIGSALSGMRILNRNRQILVFTLLAGLVAAGNAIGHAAVIYADRILQPTQFPAGEGSGSLYGLSLPDIVSYSLGFFLDFATVFCLVFLLGSLFMSLSFQRGGAVSFPAGMKMAKKSLRSIVIWSLVLALAGMLLDRMYVFWSIFWFPHETGFLYTLGYGFFISMITQFPFNWTLDWNMLTEVPGYGGRSLLLLIYPFGVLETLHFSGITLILFVLTPFVVPLIVLEHRGVGPALAGSVFLIKKTWAELTSCGIFLGIIAAGMFLLHRLIQAASGIVSPYETVSFQPPVVWIALALIYDFALVTVVFVLATIGGIAVLDLYTSAKNRRISLSSGPGPGSGPDHSVMEDSGE